MRADQLTEPVAHHGEGPVWWPAWGGLRWVDMLAGDVLTLAGDGSVTRMRCGSVAAALRPRARGGAVIALERGFALQDEDDGPVRALPEVWSDPGVRFNDGGCDPDGRFYCGSMAYDQTTGKGALYRLDPDGGAIRVLSEVTVSNGLAWSPDGHIAYYVDSPTRRIDVFDYDKDQGLTGRRTLAEIPSGESVPDGLCVDAEGGVWVALWGGGAVLRYRADGALDGRIELPVRQVTACTFGGSGLDELFITTSRAGEGAGDKEAGAVFVVRPGISGRTTLPFAG